VRTLYGKLALVLALLLVALGALYAGFTFWSTGVFLQEVNQRLNRNLARQLLVQQHMAGGRRLDQAQIKSLFSHYMKINPAIEIYLLDAKGNILAYEAPKGRVKRHRIDLGPIRRFLADDTRLPILGEDPRSLHRRKIFSAAAYPFDGPPRQYLYVILGGEAYDSVRHRFHDSYFVQLSTAAAVLGGLFGLVAGLFLFNLLTRRLRRLTAAMERFRASGFRDHTPYAAEAHGDEVERLGATFDAMAERIREQVQALEAKDSYTARHSARVAKYSVMLGRRLGLPEGQLKLLKQGALMHDLGKIGVADTILNKPGSLTEEEFAVMRNHPVVTAAIMRPLKRFKEFAEIAAWHHERWDGRGYPDGLAGEAIPLLARIVAIADTWDAMTGDRIYRKGMSVETALATLEQEREMGQWDPRLLEEFITMVRAEQAAQREIEQALFDGEPTPASGGA